MENGVCALKFSVVVEIIMTDTFSKKRLLLDKILWLTGRKQDGLGECQPHIFVSNWIWKYIFLSHFDT